MSIQSENPYAPPPPLQGEQPIVARTTDLLLASQDKRFINAIVDNLITAGIGYVAGLGFGVLFMLMRADPTVEVVGDELLTFQIMSYCVGIMVTVVYFSVTETLLQASPAKLLTGTRVVSKEGGPHSFGQILARSFCRFIPFEAFSFLGSERPVGWHDSISGTRVIDIRKAK